MGRTRAFEIFTRIARIAAFCESRRIPAREGCELAAASPRGSADVNPGRREFLRQSAGLAALAAAGDLAVLRGAASAAKAPKPDLKIAIVGAGLAGLVCADELRKNGIPATIFDAGSRVGGRCWSLRGFFPGQVAERGGEFIDTPHKTMLGYAREFGLTLEDVDKQPGEVFYFFNGQLYSNAQVVDEYRAFVAAMRPDLRQLSREPTAERHTDLDRALDALSLADYLHTRGAGPLLTRVIEQAYKAEYGLEIAQQSCLNFLLFIHADRRSKFTPFGVFSDERYHVVEGNDAIVDGLARRLQGQIRLGMRLARISRTTGGRAQLTFDQGSSTKDLAFDAVVLAIPFTTLREVDLDATLGLPDWKISAIESLGYGTNAKMMIGFDGRPWIEAGGNGESYSDLAHHQLTWETNPVAATLRRAVLTDYASGARGAGLNSADPQAEASLFLADLERVFPGASSAATRDAGGKLVVHLEHWPSNPLTRGSYTCYLPGQFTRIAGNEGKPVGNLYFAGEHANSFYDWQGFMEGAALSGIDAARVILQVIKGRVRS